MSTPHEPPPLEQKTRARLEPGQPRRPCSQHPHWPECTQLSMIGGQKVVIIQLSFRGGRSATQPGHLPRTSFREGGRPPSFAPSRQSRVRMQPPHQTAGCLRCRRGGRRPGGRLRLAALRVSPHGCLRCNGPRLWALCGDGLPGAVVSSRRWFRSASPLSLATSDDSCTKPHVVHNGTFWWTRPARPVVLIRLCVRGQSVDIDMPSDQSIILLWVS